MKKILYVFGIFWFMVAYHQLGTMTTTAVDPLSPLYRRWQAVNVSDTYITFLAEGIILYGPDGTFGTCCYPRTFTRQDSILNFRNVPPKDIPSFVQKVDCSAVRCASVDSWTIVTLTNDQLILRTPTDNRTYKAN